MGAAAVCGFDCDQGVTASARDDHNDYHNINTIWFARDSNLFAAGPFCSSPPFHSLHLIFLSDALDTAWVNVHKNEITNVDLVNVDIQSLQLARGTFYFSSEPANSFLFPSVPIVA